MTEMLVGIADRQNCSSIIAEMVRNKANLNVRTLGRSGDAWKTEDVALPRKRTLVLHSKAGCLIILRKSAELDSSTTLGRTKLVAAVVGGPQLLPPETAPETALVALVVLPRSSFGTTPLSLACHAKHTEAVEAKRVAGSRDAGLALSIPSPSGSNLGGETR